MDGLDVVGVREKGLAPVLDSLGRFGDGLLKLDERPPVGRNWSLHKPQEPRFVLDGSDLKASECAGGEGGRRVGELLHNLLDKGDVPHGKDQLGLAFLQLVEEGLHVLPPQAFELLRLPVDQNALVPQSLLKQLGCLASALGGTHPYLCGAAPRL